MYKRGKFLTFIIGAIVVFFLTVTQALAQARLTERSNVFINGIGPIRVGMTVSQASQVGGIRLVREDSGGEEYGCLFFKPQRQPQGIGFMVTNGRISRVDVWENRRIATVKGAKIGDTEARIKSLYPRQIQVTPHQYEQGGHYLTFVPKDRSDRNYRLVFETDGNRVTRFRSGKLPEVEYVEGCV